MARGVERAELVRLVLVLLVPQLLGNGEHGSAKRADIDLPRRLMVLVLRGFAIIGPSELIAEKLQVAGIDFRDRIDQCLS